MSAEESARVPVSVTSTSVSVGRAKRRGVIVAHPSFRPITGNEGFAGPPSCLDREANAAFLRPPQNGKEATARSTDRRIPVNFKALIRRLTIGGHARQL